MFHVGTHCLGKGRYRFKVWAPERKQIKLCLVHPLEKQLQMEADEQGYFTVDVEGIEDGAEYFFSVENGKNLPDPASHFQPKGVHGPSAVVDHERYEWNDSTWTGIPFRELILYELHVGTFTDEGTFEAIIPRLDDLKAVGINALEIMPIAQFPGNRNWGYDAVFPYAVQNSYGGPAGLKKLVDACHQKGMAVFLDVVYNHLGPEGNYFSEFGPYFSDRYKVPWGAAVNFDWEWSDGVREYFANNALHWFDHYHIDGLRLDAIHAIFDLGAVHFWELFHARIRAFEERKGRKVYTVAESDLNNPKVVTHPDCGGYGFTAQWLDDFHHALYVLLHEEGKKMYVDFGAMEQLAKAYTDGFVHSGENVTFRKRKFGKSSAGIPSDRFVVFTDNHDQSGNRVTGARLASLIDHDRLKIAAAAMLLSPYIPMLFMGEEYAEHNPFFYFVSHSDEDLIKAVREGRKEEFAAHKWEVEPADPQSEKTFADSKLNWESRKRGEHAAMLRWYTELISLRKTHAALQSREKNDIRASIVGEKGLLLHRQSASGTDHIFVLFNFSTEPITHFLPSIKTTMHKLLDSKDDCWSAAPNNITSKAPSLARAGAHVKLSGLSVVVYGNKE